MFQAIKGWFSVSDESGSDAVPDVNAEKTTLDDSGGDKLGNVLNFAKDWGSQVYHKVVQSGEEAVHMISDKTRLIEVGSAVRGVVDKVPIIRDFQRLQDDFAAEQASKRGSHADSDAVLLPWQPEAAGVTDASVLDKIRSRVLELSKHPNTFLVSPPAEAHVDDEVFRSPDNVHLANALLENDPNLSEMRYKLVPNQIREDLFWRNYFYRLSIVRQSFQLSAMADSGSEDFVCVDQDSHWYQSTSDSTAPESSTPPAVQPTRTTSGSRKQRPSSNSKRTSKRQSGGPPPPQPVPTTESPSTKPTTTPKQRLTPEVAPTSMALSGTVETTTTTTAALEATPKPPATVSSPTKNVSEVDELTAEELLEAELASDLNAFDLAPSDDAQLDRELELEILAELDDQAGVTN